MTSIWQILPSWIENVPPFLFLWKVAKHQGEFINYGKMGVASMGGGGQSILDPNWGDKIFWTSLVISAYLGQNWLSHPLQPKTCPWLVIAGDSWCPGIAHHFLARAEESKMADTSSKFAPWLMIFFSESGHMNKTSHVSPTERQSRYPIVWCKFPYKEIIKMYWNYVMIM